MDKISNLILLFCFGGLGTLSRFGLNHAFGILATPSAPWGTTLINILGCFCFGAIAESFQLQEHWNIETRTLILTGFFGAFTTFSTYMYEMHDLLTKGSYLHAIIGFSLQNIVGFTALVLGISVTRILFYH